MQHIVHSFFIVALLTCVFTGQANAGDSIDRIKRGEHLYPHWTYEKPEHAAYMPQYSSNHDPKNSHPAQWIGQEWDTSKWNSDWTPEKTIRRFYKAHIFHAQYFETQEIAEDQFVHTPVLELGSRFWSLSDLDQRRTLKLFADQTGVFHQGYTGILLRDWDTHKILGNISPRGMFLR